MVSGGLKFHCWRTISRNEVPPSEDQRKTNSCVLAVSFSSKTSDISFSLCGWSKISRIVWDPESVGVAAAVRLLNSRRWFDGVVTTCIRYRGYVSDELKSSPSIGS